MGSIAMRVDPRESTLDVITKRTGALTWSNLPSGIEHPEIVASATGSGCIAVALRFPASFMAVNSPWMVKCFQPELDGSITTAVVFTVDRREAQGTNFCYKACDETGGPYATVGPSILKHLSPIIGDSTSAQYAREWRDRCAQAGQARRAARAAAARIKDGCRIKLPTPITFKSGIVADEFIAVHGRWRKRGRTSEGLAFRDVVTGGLFALTRADLARAAIIG